SNSPRKLEESAHPKGVAFQRKFVAHFESDEIDLISIAPVIRPSRLYSLVVQFSKIKLRFVVIAVFQRRLL
ncbi:hypothetical protein, partial [Paenibacillus cineris]|uniref:hypothetical protein n=1 Tax=Paenibacillus cineris TaxID=237530 RepID=UPI001BB40BEA